MSYQVICNGCQYAEDIPGDCHIRCRRPQDTPTPERKTWQGCGCYPLCFDACTVQKCEARVEVTP
jgi:hypothetical protein